MMDIDPLIALYMNLFREKSSSNAVNALNAVKGVNAV